MDHALGESCKMKVYLHDTDTILLINTRCLLVSPDDVSAPLRA